MKLRRGGIMMDEATWEQYWIPAAENILDFDWSLTIKKQDDEFFTQLDKLLGVDIFTRYNPRDPDSDRPLPDDWKRFLTMLASPHGKTILKMYQAKYGVNYEHSD